MSNFHEQAMSFVYQQVLHRLLGFFSRPERIALQLLIQRLLVAAGGIERIAHFRVLLVHEGGKECAYTLAFLRAAQLSIAGRSPDTFVLRVAVLCQPRVTTNVMARIQTQCAELFLYDDPRVELLLVDDEGISRQHKPLPVAQRSSFLDRIQVLMSGHLTRGDARVTFFYTDLLSRATLYRSACAWGGAVNALIDRRPPACLDQYSAWIRRVAYRQGYALNGTHRESFETAVKLCSRLHEDYRQLLRLSASSAPLASVICSSNDISIINVFDCLSRDMDIVQSQVLLFMEGTRNTPSLDIEEPLTAAVLVNAHLNGLQGAYRQGLAYSTGVDAFWQGIASKYKARSGYKGQLIQQLVAAFNTPKRIDKLRGLATRYLGQLHGVNDEQLGCFIYSPFVNKGRGLETFLQHRYPDKLHSIIKLRQVLMDQAAASQADLASWLEAVSGLPLASLQALYQMSDIDFDRDSSLIGTLWAYDPCKPAPQARLAGQA